LKPSVLLTDPIAAAGEALLAASARVIKAPDTDPATVRRLAHEADGVVIRSKLPDDIFEAAPDLRAVMIHGTGIDLVPLAEANARGIPVANIPGGNAQSVAEYCVMAMLLLARNALGIIGTLRSGAWDEARAAASVARELQGRTLGIVGVGEIGSRLAKILRHGFDMRVLGNQRRLERLPAEAEPASLDHLVAESDFIVVTCPLTAETRHLFNRERLRSMKPGAWLVNVGRGAVVEEQALIEALRERRIAGAMLDVYEHYRLPPGHALFSLDNVILTPHLAGATIESRERMSLAAAEDLLRMLAGERPRHLVNPEVWKGK
jgi:D-3-phosphoglycerate dehydrogenase